MSLILIHLIKSVWSSSMRATGRSSFRKQVEELLYKTLLMLMVTGVVTTDKLHLQSFYLLL